MTQHDAMMRFAGLTRDLVGPAVRRAARYAVRHAAFAGVAVFAAMVPVSAAHAQRDTARKSAQIPADARPPRGMCRIWLENVPAAQQPAATDCATAVKNRPSNGRVIFGDDYADSTKTKGDNNGKLPPGIKGFTGVKPAPAIVLPKRPPE